MKKFEATSRNEEAASAFPEINHRAFKTWPGQKKRSEHGVGRTKGEVRERNGESDFQPDHAILNISDVRCPIALPLCSRFTFHVSWRSRLLHKAPKALKGNFTIQTFRLHEKKLWHEKKRTTTTATRTRSHAALWKILFTEFPPDERGILGVRKQKSPQDPVPSWT